MKNILKNSIMLTLAMVVLLGVSTNVAKASALIITTDNATVTGQTSADLNGSFSGSPTVNTWFEWGTSSGQVSSGSGIQVGQESFASAVGSMTPYSLVTGLSAGTTYYFRAVGFDNTNVTSYGSVLPFTTLPAPSSTPPTLNTNNATPSSITQTSADLNGDFSGSPTVNTYFEYGTDPNLAGNVTTVGETSQSLASGPMTFNLPGLTAGTTYYFRAVGFDNTNITSYGSILSFTTLPSSGGGSGSSPTITTSAVSNKTTTTATLNGTFSSSPDNTWFEYGTTSGQVSTGIGSIVDQGKTAQSTASGTMTFNLTGLTAGTTYYFRAVGFNNNGTDYGSILSFTTSTPSGGGGGGGSGGSSSSGSSSTTTSSTSSVKLNVVTSLVTIVTKTSAKVSGIVINSNNGTEVWFDYGKTVSLGQSTLKRQIANAPSVQLFDVLTNLTPDTIYFYRYSAKNKIGQVNGEIKIFKTLPASSAIPPLTPSIPTTNTATPVTSDVISTTNDNINLVSLKIESDLDSVKSGDNINYKITYKNIGDKNIKDVILRASIPARTEFVNSSVGDFGSDNIITANLGEVSAGEENSVFIKVKVGGDVKDKDVLVASASIIYTDGENGTQKDITDYLLINVIKDTGSNLAAASIFGNFSNIIPSTLVGWLFLLLIIIGIVMLGKKLYVEVNWKRITGQLKK